MQNRVYYLGVYQKTCKLPVALYKEIISADKR